VENRIQLKQKSSTLLQVENITASCQSGCCTSWAIKTCNFVFRL